MVPARPDGTGRAAAHRALPLAARKARRENPVIMSFIIS
jgi:hypothetical protein